MSEITHDEAQRLKIQNKKYEEALKKIARWDEMMYSPREMGYFAKKSLKD